MTQGMEKLPQWSGVVGGTGETVNYKKANVCIAFELPGLGAGQYPIWIRKACIRDVRFRQTVVTNHKNAYDNGRQATCYPECDHRVKGRPGGPGSKEIKRRIGVDIGFRIVLFLLWDGNNLGPWSLNRNTRKMKRS